MEGRELRHSFHEHPLTLKAEEHMTNGCLLPISSPFYNCGECRYFLHKVYVELPCSLDHFLHPKHPLASLECAPCPDEINCDGCLLPISGPFYSCGECRYFLHKVCAELPSALDHPLHPKHSLTLLPRSPYPDGYYCSFCKKDGSGLVYHCSVCEFDLDTGCAFPTYKIKDKCHPHPLTPEQVPAALACHICRVQDKGLFYKCDVCPFWVHQNCTTEHSDHDHPYPFRVLQHFFHKHPLILKVERSKANGGNDLPEKEINCNGCRIPISGPFYSCGECEYSLHKVCAELPNELDHPLHPEHPLTLQMFSYNRCDLCNSYGESSFSYHCSICASGTSKFEVDVKCASSSLKIKDECHPHPLTPLQVPIAFVCHICRKKEEGLSYKCYSCPFWVHQNCIFSADTVEHSDREDPYPFVKQQHFFHDHPLILIANEHKTGDGIDRSNVKIKCHGCKTQILGPFYSCGECRYFLHKVCAELPNALDHPLHPQHPLTLLKDQRYLECSLCRETRFDMGLGYTCSKCSFYVDMTCASATHVIHDKCHPHPLTPSQVPISFPCHICQKKEEGLSYKCNICPFWVHQNCTLLPDTAKHSDHDHVLKFFPSIPFEFSKFSKFCDMCHNTLFMFQCIYGCDKCLFFGHVSCARSEIIQSPSRDQNIDGQSLILLPMKQDSTDCISRFVQKYIDEGANIENKIDHFDHEHSLFLIDEETTGNITCDACAIRISAPSYGCVECDYFLHKCCTDLPKQIQGHATYPEHRLNLRSAQRVLWCYCCDQYCNSFCYKCYECNYSFAMDIKCRSMMEGDVVVYHEAHKHPFFPKIKPSSTFCNACGCPHYGTEYMLKCDTCSFVLCFRCAMAPAVIKHRYGGKSEEPFILTYSPPPSENHHYGDEYLCEICLEELNPKEWYYHCLFADQFAHIQCMVRSGADSNIKYGKSHMIKEVHEQHEEVTTISCKYDCTPCSNCRHPMRITGSRYGDGGGVGYECKTCNFRSHLICPRKEDS